jgi:predicted sulfurtransferase
MPAKVIAFPVQTMCHVCKVPCGPDELSQCYECLEKFCRHCSECACDRVAAQLADLMPSAKLARTEP